MSPMTRIEKDSLGSEEVSQDYYWGASTERCRKQFKIGTTRMPLGVIRAFGVHKKVAAHVNVSLRLLDESLGAVIIEAADEVARGILDDHFPLSIWQTGSGTATHMNVNEVIANRANEKLGAPLGSKSPVHPNDHVNKGQSSNDSFGTVMHISAVSQMHHQLWPALDHFIEAIMIKRDAFMDRVKIGRTHLQDAAPLRVGDEWGAFVHTLQASRKRLEVSTKALLTIAQGGTAVGTGLNAHPQFAQTFAKELSKETGHTFVPHDAPFFLMTMHDDLVALANDLSVLAGDLMKIANDLRLLSCGPRAGIGELILPQNEPGSSIMPGKVNPTQIESMLMVCVQAQALASAVSHAGASGQLQLNVMKPLIIHNILEIINLLSDSMYSMRIHCIDNLSVNEAVIGKSVDASLMLVTALVPHIGYDKASQMARYALENDCSLRQASHVLGFVSEEEFDRWVSSTKMARPHG